MTCAPGRRRFAPPRSARAALRPWRSAFSALQARPVLRSPGATCGGARLCTTQEAEDDDWEPELPEAGLEDSLEDGLEDGAGEEGSEEGRALAVALARAASDTKAVDVLVLHVAPLVYWTSYLARPWLRVCGRACALAPRQRSRGAPVRARVPGPVARSSAQR